MPNSAGPRIHTLDGWRGVAILLVLAEHTLTHTRFRDLIWAHLGSLGVDIFFVVSGYIITLRFLQERATTSTIDLRAFYARRAFRILPLVCAYLLTLCILSLFVNLVDFHPPEVVGALFFFRNYQLAAHPHGVYTSHFWSLSIEEHFYLLWPAILLWLANRRSLWFAFAGAIACAMWRFYDCTHPTSWIGRMLPGADPMLRTIRTDTRFDGLLLGCAVAILLTRPRVRDFIFRNFPKETPLFTLTLLMLNFVRTHAWPALSTYVLIAFTLASTLVVQEGLAHKSLNARLLVWIGTISYSAYVWQELFLVLPVPSVSPLGRLAYFPLNLISVFAVSALSFYFIERPAIALGKRVLTQKKASIPAMASV